VQPSLREFAEAHIDSEGYHLDGTSVTVTFYGWSMQSVPFVFRDGAFHEVTEA